VKDKAWLLMGGLLLLALAAASPLLGTLGLPREGAKAPNCRSNLKQLSTAVSMYLQDYDGRYPPCSAWSDALLPYALTPRTFHCPQDDSPWSYALNADLGAVSEAQLPRPAATVLLFETDLHKTNACGTAVDAVFDRHARGSNWAFVDGHVDWRRTTPDFGAVAAAKDRQ
jgi:prepilin-type processing-associated H-X9-DG protein